VIDRGCDWTRDIKAPTFSKADTAKTRSEVSKSAAEIREHNAARAAICPQAKA